MRRRLDLAASLIAQPPLFFLDEPTTGQDPRTRTQMWDVQSYLPVIIPGILVQTLPCRRGNLPACKNIESTIGPIRRPVVFLPSKHNCPNTAKNNGIF